MEHGPVAMDLNFALLPFPSKLNLQIWSFQSFIFN